MATVRKRSWSTATGIAKEAWVVSYTDVQGARRLKTFARKKEADAFRDEVAHDVKAGVHIPESQTTTIADAGEKWIVSGENAGLERSTIEMYRQHLELHIKPLVGKLLLPKVTVPVVRKFQDDLRAAGRSPAMVKRVTVSLGGILSDAQERGSTSKNAVRDMARGGTKRQAKVDKRKKKRIQVGVDIPTPSEVSAMLNASEGRYRPLLLTAVFTGLRASELRGLRWADVDFDKKSIRVRQRADKFHEIGMPKSDAGQRSIPMGVNLTNTLREWKFQCPKGDLGLVFPNGEGNVEWHANIINRGLIPAQLAAGVSVDTGKRDKDGQPIFAAKYPGMHALRHFFASWCINPPSSGGLGLPVKVVQERMGHSSMTMTADVYGHLFPETNDDDALAAAERKLLAAANAT